jgi:hypothetical protein
MPDIHFRVDGAKVVPQAMAPQIAFEVNIANSQSEAIHTIVLRSQIQIEAPRRQYNREEQQRLGDLFGEPERWSRTLRGMLWTHAQAIVPAFTGSTVAELHVPCTFDFNVAATKYFYSLDQGEIPLCLMFSGSVFYENGESLSIAPISWDKEARFRLPVSTWRAMMDEYYPNSAWLCLGRDAFERLSEYKTANGIPTWEQAIEDLVDAARGAIAR